MRLIVAEDAADLAKRGADLVSAAIAEEPTMNIVPATGNTPLGLYERLAGRVAAGDLNASRLRVFQLDEYLGLEPDDPRLLYGWMLRSFVGPLGIPAKNVVRLPSDTRDPASACRSYERKVEALGGFGLIILGLGPNGHLGFNEPPAEPDSPTRAVNLTKESLASNGNYWGGKNRVPRQALTAGMNLILASQHIILLVSGPHKRMIADKVLHGPVTPELPASLVS